MRILVAYDGSPPAEAAVDEVVRRPWPAGSQVRLVTVLEPPFHVGTPDVLGFFAAAAERSRALLHEDAYERLCQVLRRFEARTDLEATCEVREGDARGSLLEAAREWRADLVVAGSNGKSGPARLFLGSVSSALVTHAPCNVEIVRARRDAA